MYNINTYGLALDYGTMQEIICEIALQSGTKIDFEDVYAGDLPDYIRSAEYFTAAEAFLVPFSVGHTIEKFEGSFGIIRLSRQPSFFSQSYESVEEIIDEIKQQVGKYLPQDFDYAAYTGQLVGKEMN